MAEWFKAHAWRACIPQKGIEGSNPSLSVPAQRLSSSLRRWSFLGLGYSLRIDDSGQTGINGPALHIQFLDDANARAIELVLQRIGLERREFLLLQAVRERAVRNGDRRVQVEHFRLVHGNPRSKFLRRRLSHLRMGPHDDARLGAVLPGLERSCGTDDVAVLVLLSVLSEIPDVACRVLGIPIESLFPELSIEEDPIEHDGHCHAKNRLLTKSDI